MADLDHRKRLSVVEANWQAKMEGCHAYAALARNESVPHRRNALRGLAVAEKHLADLLFGRILALGRAEPHSLPGQAYFAVTWAGPAAFEDLVATARKFNL